MDVSEKFDRAVIIVPLDDDAARELEALEVNHPGFPGDSQA